MNEQELLEIEKRHLVLDQHDWREETDEDGEEWIRIPDGHDIHFWNIEDTNKCCYDVIRFISHSKQDIPALIAEVRRLKAELEHLSTVGESLATSLDGVKAENARLTSEVERLKNLCIIASQTMTVIDEWLGSASTRQAATDSMWRLNRALEQNGFPYENKHILDWRGSILHELNDAGFYPNSPDAYGADCRFVYDPSASEKKRIFGNAVGPTLKEVVADNARLRAAITESIADVKGAQFTDNTWKEAEAEKRGILAGLENALKGGEG